MWTDFISFQYECSCILKGGSVPSSKWQWRRWRWWRRCDWSWVHTITFISSPKSSKSKWFKVGLLCTMPPAMACSRPAKVCHFGKLSVSASLCIVHVSIWSYFGGELGVQADHFPKKIELYGSKMRRRDTHTADITWKLQIYWYTFYNIPWVNLIDG